MKQGELFCVIDTNGNDAPEDWFLERDKWLEPEIDELEIMFERYTAWMQ